MNSDDDFKKGNIEFKLTLRKKEIDEILNSNRKIENFELDCNKKINNYILDIEDINIPQIYKIHNFKNYFSSVNTNSI